MDRRQFSVGAAMALLGGAAITISGCGSGGRSITASTPPLIDVAGTVAANHSHLAVITAAQLGAGGALDLDIRGTATHTHMVALTASELTIVRGGGMVQKESSGSSHTHTVTFNG